MALSDATARQAKDYTLGDSDGLSLGVTAARAGYQPLHPPPAPAPHPHPNWQSFLRANNLVSSMSRRGNGHDNAIAESFSSFSSF